MRPNKQSQCHERGRRPRREASRPNFHINFLSANHTKCSTVAVHQCIFPPHTLQASYSISYFATNIFSHNNENCLLMQGVPKTHSFPELPTKYENLMSYSSRHPLPPITRDQVNVIPSQAAFYQ